MDNKQTDHNGQPLTYWGGLAENKKQTAVDWLIRKLYESIALPSKHIEEIKAKAKAMEKEQKENAYYEGKENGFKEQFDQYYKETYEQ
jgi:coenzyme F420-reducing hydrogenase alpha subunit